MKKLTFIPVAATVALLLSLPACKGYDSKKAEADRAAWLASLGDSISMISKQRLEDSLRLETLRASVAEEILRFYTVNNPREVEPYIILSERKANYPLSATGIAARIMQNEQFELIAALSGKRFNAVRVSVPGGASVTSATVPADQGLNYTAAGLTTVAFTGEAADSIGAAVYNACLAPGASAGTSVSVQYLQDGNVQHTLTLSPIQKDWVGTTWKVASQQRESHLLEKQLQISASKIQILRITLQRESEKN